MHLRLTTIVLAAIALLVLAAVAVAPATRIDLARSSVPIAVASTTAPPEVPLADILIGRYQPGFFPDLDGIVAASPRTGRVVWLRLQAELPTNERAWFVRVERANVDRVAVVLPARPAVEVAESRFFQIGSWDARWPDGFVLPLPADTRGAVAIYLRVEGSVDVDLRPQLIDGSVLAEREAAAIRLFALIYGVLLATLILCFVRPLRSVGAGGVGMAAVTIIAALTVALINDHLPLPLRAVLDPWLSGSIVYASTVLLAGALLIVARYQSAIEENAGGLAAWYMRIGVALVLLAVLGFYVPTEHADLLRRVAEFIWSQAWLLVLVAFAIDRRRLSAVPITLMGLLIAALILRALAAAGVVPPSALALYAYQLMMAVLLLSLVLLPWLRSLPIKAPRAPPVVPEPSVGERWSQAEASMAATISAALRYGGASEADWVVARRLVDTLKSLLNARSVAVVRSTQHGEPRVLAEPVSATPMYVALLRDRARVLRSLLRLRSPQQLFLPMDDTGLSQIALLPYRFDNEGWTAVFLEREGAGFDAGELLRIEAFVAAARRVAGTALDEREATLRADLDPALSVLNAEALHRELRSAFERCRDGGDPIALLRIPLAGEGGFEVRALAVIEALEAFDSLPHHLLGRPGPDEFWLVLPGLDVPPARLLAEQLHQRLAPPMLPVSGLAPAGQRPRVAEWIIGIAAITPGERVPRPMIERAGDALGRARVPGALAVQAVVADLP